MRFLVSGGTGSGGDGQLSIYAGSLVLNSNIQLAGNTYPNVDEGQSIGNAGARFLGVYQRSAFFKVAALPGSPTEGQCAWDNSDHKLKCYDGTTWQGAW